MGLLDIKEIALEEYNRDGRPACWAVLRGFANNGDISLGVAYNILALIVKEADNE